jgi:hypothetical protein
MTQLTQRFRHGRGDPLVIVRLGLSQPTICHERINHGGVGLDAIHRDSATLASCITTLPIAMTSLAQAVALVDPRGIGGAIKHRGPPVCASA